jgi:poly(3-hydroxyalkanoate) synthetase
LAQIDKSPALCDHDKQKFAFYTRQLLCAWAPSNVPFINPNVRMRALETRRACLVDGRFHALAGTHADRLPA